MVMQAFGSEVTHIHRSDRFNIELKSSTVWNDLELNCARMEW